MNIGEYCVIAISSNKGTESSFLTAISKNQGTIAFVNKEEKWRSTDGKNGNCFIFSLIVLDDYRDKTDQATQLLSNMTFNEKKIIIYAHTNDYLCRNKIETAITDKKVASVDYKEFSHQPNNSNFQLLETFYECVKLSENFEECLITLIEKSLKKKHNPHLIALSILCQGYLAAHNEIKLPEGVSFSDTKKGVTEAQDWWRPAFEDAFEEVDGKYKIKKDEKEKDIGFNNTILSNELTSMGKDCKNNKGAIESLFNGIKDAENGQSFTAKVISTYECLKEVFW